LGGKEKGGPRCKGLGDGKTSERGLQGEPGRRPEKFRGSSRRGVGVLLAAPEKRKKYGFLGLWTGRPRKGKVRRDRKKGKASGLHELGRRGRSGERAQVRSSMGGFGEQSFSRNRGGGGRNGMGRGKEEHSAGGGGRVKQKTERKASQREQNNVEKGGVRMEKEDCILFARGKISMIVRRRRMNAR